MARFPSYLVCADEARLRGDEGDTLMEIFSAGLPVKVLAQTDDILAESAVGGDSHLAFGARGKRLVDMAVGLNEVYVLRAGGSHLFRLRERVLDGLAFAGPALFSVFSGAGTGGLPAYLAAAAATESRAFPAFTYDPSAGATWAARFRLEANSQVELDWPVQRFAYEDENHQRVEVDVAFTAVDFVACDARFARHFARVPRETWSARLVPVDQYMSRGATPTRDEVPYVLMVDRENVLQKVVVDDELVRAALRCRDAWHSLQELGGVHNSHAERLLAREREAWEDRRQREVAPEPAVAAPALVPAPEPERVPSSDEPYIESARCTTCNECMRVNDKMFGYDENRQARVVDASAGTFRQLVEAAENCQVAIIHPGKPRDPNEPGLADLLERAAVFR
jgi:hypothetical protein